MYKEPVDSKIEDATESSLSSTLIILKHNMYLLARCRVVCILKNSGTCQYVCDFITMAVHVSLRFSVYWI